MNRTIITSLILFFTTLVVHADQAIHLNTQEKIQAMFLLKYAFQLRGYCEPCNNHEINYIDVEEVKAKKIPYGWHILVNDDVVDLAYLYYKQDTHWINVAKVLDMNVSGVPMYLSDRTVNEPDSFDME